MWMGKKEVKSEDSVTMSWLDNSLLQMRRAECVDLLREESESSRKLIVQTENCSRVSANLCGRSPHSRFFIIC